jgi:hypothetical protein
MRVLRIFSWVPDATETAVKFWPGRKCLQNGHFRAARIGQSQAQALENADAGRTALPRSYENGESWTIG